MSDATSPDDATEAEHRAYSNIMRHMLKLTPTSRMRVLGAIAMILKPAVVPTPPSTGPSEPPT